MSESDSEYLTATFGSDSDTSRDFDYYDELTKFNDKYEDIILSDYKLKRFQEQFIYKLNYITDKNINKHVKKLEKYGTIEIIKGIDDFIKQNKFTYLGLYFQYKGLIKDINPVRHDEFVMYIINQSY